MPGLKRLRTKIKEMHPDGRSATALVRTQPPADDHGEARGGVRVQPKPNQTQALVLTGTVRSPAPWSPAHTEGFPERGWQRLPLQELFAILCLAPITAGSA